MKLLLKLLLVFILSPIFPLAADNTLVTEAPNKATDNTTSNELTQYLINLGRYLGFDLTIDPSKLTPPLPLDNLVRTLIDLTNTQLIEVYMISSIFGATPINSLVPLFVPDAISGAAIINEAANRTFKDTTYSTADPNKISVIPSVDQKTSVDPNTGVGQYQADPINQTIFNILSTVDATFCSTDLTTLDKCSFLYPTQILKSVIGKLPGYNDTPATAFYGANYIQGLMSQLNVNSLLAPLFYSTSNGSQGSVDVGLSAPTQATQAANFIRYASGTVAPIKTITYQDYKKLYDDADFNDKKNLTDTDSINAKLKARDTLLTYFANMRTYTARVSVGMGNLSYILSKRMSQNLGHSVVTTQAQEEFNMATRRLNIINPNTKSWIEEINTASAATVQKEIAILLSEINYQLYLSRQQEERMLLVQSILLFTLVQPPSRNPELISSGSVPNIPGVPVS